MWTSLLASSSSFFNSKYLCSFVKDDSPAVVKSSMSKCCCCFMCRVVVLFMIVVSLYMVYSNPDTGPATLKWRKPVCWLHCSVFNLIFVSYDHSGFWLSLKYCQVLVLEVLVSMLVIKVFW